LPAAGVAEGDEGAAGAGGEGGLQAGAAGVDAEDAERAGAGEDIDLAEGHARVGGGDRVELELGGLDHGAGRCPAPDGEEQLREAGGRRADADAGAEVAAGAAGGERDLQPVSAVGAASGRRLKLNVDPGRVARGGEDADAA